MRTLIAVLAMVATWPTLATAQKGMPHGQHFNLNLIGMAKAKRMALPDSTADSSLSGGHVIFVALGGPDSAVQTRILLSKDTTGGFRVIDKNGTDGSAAFALPATGTYTVYASPKGKPGGKAELSTCATDTVTDTLARTTLCSTERTVQVRAKGGPKWSNVTSALTTVALAPTDTTLIAACGGATVGLFNPCLLDYFWGHTGNGLRLLQLRFYPVAQP